MKSNRLCAQFSCQQIACTRDKFGNVLVGSPDNVHRVYYLWGLRQDPAPTITRDGRVLPPRWQVGVASKCFVPTLRLRNSRE